MEACVTLKRWSLRAVAALFAVIIVANPANAQARLDQLVTSTSARGGFTLVENGAAAPILHDKGDAAVVGHTVEDLADDIQAVSGVRPRIADGSDAVSGNIVVIGTLGHNAIIDRLAAAGKFDASGLRGDWESYLIVTVRRPLPGVENALLIVGSDRRGTAYGAFELSAAIGVSPWRWWADVAPAHRDRIIVSPGAHRFGSPSVRYRGIFINDEDWGLFPWVAKTFDPETGNFGPKTYRKVFELLLRLKANTLWPAMHRTSRPFNADPRNARLADEYAIVMGSSHAEPMLRNNVGEWTAAPGSFNYASNADGVKAYWRQRVQTNAPFESLWTLGMRGIHDSGMQGGKSVADRVSLLDRIIRDQRAMLADAAPRASYGTPQVFMPYKEVLELYRNGLNVPDDVTLMWPDDNFGYIRQFPKASEQARAGGAGIYYHISYLGAPLSYIWLNTTPPALTQEELVRAWDQGARKIWILNVGDIKPGEIGISHFFDLAWNVGKWRDRSQKQWLTDWAGRTFGEEAAQPVADVLDTYFTLNFERRPEHLQWWLPGHKPRFSDLTPAAQDERLRRFDALVRAEQAAGATLPERLRDAYFELVAYPVEASAAANWRYFANERYARLIDTDPLMARSAGGAAREADARIAELTARYNDALSGKWRFIMAPEPADNIWSGAFRLDQAILPAPGLVDPATRFRDAVARSAPDGTIVAEAEDSMPAAGWRLIAGLGRGRGSVAADRPGARLEMPVDVKGGEGRRLRIGLLPLYPLEGDGGTLRIDVSVDGGQPVAIAVERRTDSPAWARAVLDNILYAAFPTSLPPGNHRVAIIARSSGIVVDRVELLDETGASASTESRD